MRLVGFVVILAACGSDVAPPTPAPEPTALLPVRARLLTDRQYANVLRDLLGDVPATDVRLPGTQAHQFLHDDVLAVDTALLSQYRVAAELVAAAVAPRSRGEVEAFAARAFRRPLEGNELAQLQGIYDQGGWSLVVEVVLQAPSFLYRSELAGELTTYELAAAIGFLFTDSLPDEQLWQAAGDGSLADPAVLETQVDRLLEDSRVREHLTTVILDWLEVHRVLTVDKLEPELRQAMFDETARFVDDTLWQRGGSLRELLTSRRAFVETPLDAHYGVRGDHDPRHRAGILTHASLLAILSTEQRESIIRRGAFVHRKLLCTPELGRPPFSEIAAVAGFTYELSESQFGHYRAANPYCAGCHRVIDPPGRALMTYDAEGSWRTTSFDGIPIESEATLILDGRELFVRNGVELAEALGNSEQVARCVVDQIAHHALGAGLADEATRRYLYQRFEASDRDLVEVFRAIALSPTFRQRSTP